MSEMKLRVSRAIDDVLVKAGIGFVDEKLSAALSTAAIAAMREPTEGMVDAGYEADNGEDRNLGERGARECWRLMADAALK